MKNTIYKLLTGSVVFLLSGCSDILDQTPVSALTQTSFFQTAADAEAAVLAGYDALQGDEVRHIIWGDARADNLKIPLETIGATDPAVLDFQNDNISSSSSYGNWSKFYNGINKVNNVLAQVPTIQSATIGSVKNRLLGEAYLLRAICYFNLVR